MTHPHGGASGDASMCPFAYLLPKSTEAKKEPDSPSPGKLKGELVGDLSPTHNTSRLQKASSQSVVPVFGSPVVATARAYVTRQARPSPPPSRPAYPPTFFPPPATAPAKPARPAS